MKIFFPVFANDLNAYNPAFWAQESMAILEENMVAANMVHRDFEPVVADYGDTINTRRPSVMLAKRKDVDDNVATQDAVGTNIAVVLNQHVYVSFVIKDAQMSKALKNLVTEFLVPAVQGQARFVDQVVLGQVYQFLGNSVGGLGTLSNSNVKSRILKLREKLNVQKAPPGGRNLLWTPGGETTALDVDMFINAATTNDGGEAMREASLGRKLSFNHYMALNSSQVAAGNTLYNTGTVAVNMAAGAAAGATSITIDNGTGALTTIGVLPAGAYVTIAGDDQVHRIVSSTGGTTPTAMVITPALAVAVADGAVVTIYVPGAVNLAAGYAAGWTKEIVVNGFTVAPKVGQLIAFGTSATTAYYSILQSSTTSILLDRPLDVAIANTDAVNIGPAGQYNFAFSRLAMGLIVRPLALPPASTGVQGQVVNYNGLSMRAVLTYDGLAQGTRVTLDMLMGVKVYNTDLGAVLLG